MRILAHFLLDKKIVYIWTKKCFHANCSGFFTKKVFNKVGLLDTKLDYSMDYEFYLRAYSKGIKIDHQNEIWSCYRLHESSKSIVSNNEQLKESEEIINSLGINKYSPFINQAIHIYYKLYRIIKKFFIGSYLPIKKYKIIIEEIK